MEQTLTKLTTEEIELAETIDELTLIDGDHSLDQLMMYAVLEVTYIEEDEWWEMFGY